MKVCIDIEANGLVNPDKIWLIVCKDIETDQLHIFRNVTTNPFEMERWHEFAKKVRLWIGHHWLGYDYPVLRRLTDSSGVWEPDNLVARSVDTLIVSKLVDYSRPQGHSIEDYGTEFGEEKLTFYKFQDAQLYNANSILFNELEKYCIRDVSIGHKVYLKYKDIIEDPKWYKSLILEHKFQLLVNDLETNGFSFNVDKANKLLDKVTKELDILDKDILKEFPIRSKLIREINPKATKYNTISLTSIPKALRDNIKDMNIGCPFSYFSWEEFNPSSHKQIVSVLDKAGWRPTDKTQTHIDTERELQRLKYLKSRSNEVDLVNRISILESKLAELRKSGWRVNETNLASLPPDAPSPARTLAKRILLESRRRTLTEWLSLVGADDRIHGKFYGIGAWTHRMAHQKPNTANIPSEFKEDGSPKLLGREMRQLWQAPRKRLLVGVDAEGIQLRIFAHYIDDKEFTDALVRGKKSDKTDPHSLNQRILGSVCKSRQAAKRFIYALLLGAGLGKLAQVLGASESETKEALNNLLQRYDGFARLKAQGIPKDAKNGYFIGLDGRKVAIPGLSAGERKHLCMSGYLQNGEAICMKAAAIKWSEDKEMLEIHKEYPWYFVDMVHDEWQTEAVNNMKIALRIAEIQANSLKLVGEELGLRCPLAGSYWNEDHNDYTIGTNWYQTH